MYPNDEYVIRVIMGILNKVDKKIKLYQNNSMRNGK